MNRGKDTTQERTLRTLLWRSGLRYRKNVKALPGKPDIVFTSRKIAVFCDGDFWHGRHWHQLSRKLSAGTNPSYWLQKIEANRRRDRRTDEALRRVGWTVLRFWETDIQRDPNHIAHKIAEIVGGGSQKSPTRVADCVRPRM
jgi:DNA mismatch endonuclease (patch repair protein)